jgi:hypothetical protein
MMHLIKPAILIGFNERIFLKKTLQLKKTFQTISFKNNSDPNFSACNQRRVARFFLILQTKTRKIYQNIRNDH